MHAAKTIMMVDDSTSNLMIGRDTLGGLYNVFILPSGEKLFALLERVLPDLILLDVDMPGMNGYDVIRRLKGDPRTVGIPVIFLTGKDDLVSELEGLTLGAVDYITKPFSPPILLKRVENHLLLKRYHDNLLEMVAVKTRIIAGLQNALLATVAEVVEYRDPNTGRHIQRTQEYLRCLLDEMRRRCLYQAVAGGWDMDFVVHSALLHDVGKIFVPESILLKPGRLDDTEFERIKEHPRQGVAVIERIAKTAAVREFLAHAKIFAESHHERWDGSGYPAGLKGEEIPLQGRLMAIVDVYDALVSARPYKNWYPHDVAVEIIRTGRGSQFDPLLVEAFLARERDFALISPR
ncbi:MAG: response regulator, partial [Planctomycetaceae bacterium]|nr:response regulator [Planctomycetaceae bacterium]